MDRACGDMGMTPVAAKGEPESRAGVRPGTLEVAERGCTGVPQTQGLPAHLHAVRRARRDVSERLELRAHRRNDIRSSVDRP